MRAYSISNGITKDNTDKLNLHPQNQKYIIIYVHVDSENI